MNLVDLAQDRESLRALVNTAMNIRVRKNTARHFDSTWQIMVFQEGPQSMNLVTKSRL